MDAFERETLKDALQRKIKGDPEKIFLSWNDDTIWDLFDVRHPFLFFKGLTALLPSNATLYFEGTTICFEAAMLYKKYQNPHSAPIDMDTLSPRPDVFHVHLNEQLIEELIPLLTRFNTRDLFSHIKAYDEKSLLLWFHDAFEGNAATFSSRFSEQSIKLFADTLGVRYASGKVPDHAHGLIQLQRILAMLDSHALPKPWWKRIFRRH